MINLSSHIKKLAAVFTGCFFIYSCENDVQQMRSLGTKKTGIEEAMNIESLFNQSGKLKAKLSAPLMYRYQLDTPRTEFPKTLRVEFYDDKTQIESRLFAKYGLYIDNQNRVLLRDSVVVFNIKGDTLRTTELWWEQDKKQFYTDKPVSIRTADKKVDGIGLVADQNFQWWTIKKPTGFLVVPDSTMPQ
jgi:LPS export ABC transporter protein LptC